MSTVFYMGDEAMSPFYDDVLKGNPNICIVTCEDKPNFEVGFEEIDEELEKQKQLEEDILLKAYNYKIV